jgi:hypothetical protein
VDGSVVAPEAAVVATVPSDRRDTISSRLMHRADRWTGRQWCASVQ